MPDSSNHLPNISRIHLFLPNLLRLPWLRADSTCLEGRVTLALTGLPAPIPAAVVPGTTCITVRQDYLRLISPSSTLSPSLLLSSDLTYICLLRHVSPLVSPLDHQVGSVASPAQASLTMLQCVFRAHLHGQAPGGHNESSSSEGLEDVWK